MEKVVRSLPDEHVVWNVVEMSSVFQPNSSWTDVISCTLAFDLQQTKRMAFNLLHRGWKVLEETNEQCYYFDENSEVFKVVAVPLGEWSKELESIAARRHVHVYLAAVGRWSLVGVLARVETSLRKFVTERRAQLELLSVSSRQFVRERVKVKTTTDWQRCHCFRWRHKSVRLGVGVVASGEVAVVWRHDCVLVAFLDVVTARRTILNVMILRYILRKERMNEHDTIKIFKYGTSLNFVPFPLSDTRSTSIRQDKTSKVLKHFHLQHKPVEHKP